MNKRKVAVYLKKLGNDFSLIQNPNYIHPKFELVQLAPRIVSPRNDLIAVVMDMDGTTTTTEEICIHSLEYMMRKISGRMDRNTWKGLNHEKDFPNIIGNSTTRHVEYLIDTYKKDIKLNELKKSFIESAVWTLLIGSDNQRKDEVKSSLRALNCESILTNEKFIELKNKRTVTKTDLRNLYTHLQKKYKNSLSIVSFHDFVRASIEIYYQRYHEILLAVSKGKSRKVAGEILTDKNKHLIEPLAGVGIFLALVKGLLGNEVVKVTDLLIEHYCRITNETKENINLRQINQKLLALSKKFESNPLKVAVVTSSIYYEANIVLTEVFNVLRDEVSSWDISKNRKKFIIEKFSNYKTFYDAFVTASDSNEIRLKPHRDLYSIALHHLGIESKDFDKVIGLEDSESGTIAIRSAGIGFCVAVPFVKSVGHNFEAASFVAKGGLPEVILKIL